MAAFALQAALDVAERRAEAKSRTVKVAYVAWLNSRTRLVRLEQSRIRYNGEVNASLRQGCSAATLQAAAETLQQWQANMAAARRELDHARLNWRLALDDWQIEKKRMEALQTLARRHQFEEKRREEQREQRLHDELSSRAAYARLSSERHEAGSIRPGRDQP